MFYLVAVVTFIATILFYTFYPRSDGIKNVDKPWAKTFIADMVVQHNAAVEAARVITYDAVENENKSAYTSWGVENIPVAQYSSYLPGNFSVSANTTTKLLCINNQTGTRDITACGHYSKDMPGTTYAQGSSDFLVSFISADNLENQLGDYLSRVAKRSLGEMVFLSKYSPEEHLRTNCGIVDCSDNIAYGNDFDPHGTCMLNNTRYLTVRLPRQITAAHDGYLLCITRLGAAYDENHDIIYPQQGE